MSPLTRKFAIGSLTASAALLFAGSALAAVSSPATAKATAEQAVAVAPAGTVMIGNFSGPIKQDSKYGPYILNRGRDFGWGWATSTDQQMGGHSTVDIALIHPGANHTQSALRISGEIKPGFPEPWAGAFWYAGHEPMQPADLSAKKELVFWAKGAPQRYAIFLLAGSGFVPRSTSFTLTPQWKEYHISLAKNFPGADWKHVIYLGFSASQPGKFEFDIDQVSLR